MSITFNAVHDQTPGYYAGDGGPSCNFHNVGACDLLRLLDLPPEPCGFLDNGAIPAIRRAIVRLLSVPRARQDAVWPAMSEGRFHQAAQTDDRVQDRLRELDAVLAHAQSIDGHVTWG